MTTPPDGNVAFKCTYNDGGTLGGPDDAVGFAGTCSTDNIIRNIRAGRVWCSSPQNQCNDWYDRGFVGKPPDNPCYESELLTRTWSFGSGVYHTGERAGKPIPMQGVQKGKVALLTTRLPGSREADRVVFAVFKIANIGPSDERQGTLVKASRRYTLRVPRSAAVTLPYWRFKRDHVQRWGTGLFRYVTDLEVSDYLHALRPFMVYSPRDREIVEHLLECCGSRPPTARRHLPVIPDVVEDRELRLKYAPGGEGDRHRKLKDYIGKNPHLLGFGPGSAKVEHRFITGDRADVVVTLKTGGYVAVEVEVEGEEYTRIGAHQALKYKALLLAQHGARVRCEAALVAYHVPEATRTFCREHNIRWLELSP